MKVNKSYEEMIDYIFDRYSETDKFLLKISNFRERLCNNKTRRNYRIVKKVYKARVLYDAGFDIKNKHYKMRLD